MHAVELSAVLWNMRRGLSREHLSMPDALQSLLALRCTFICLIETWHADGEHLPGHARICLP